MLQYDDAQMADFRGYDLVHHDDLNYVASAHAECKLITICMPITINVFANENLYFLPLFFHLRYNLVVMF